MAMVMVMVMAAIFVGLDLLCEDLLTRGMVIIEMGWMYGDGKVEI